MKTTVITAPRVSPPFSFSQLWIGPLVRLGLIRSKNRVATAIRNFSATEDDTAWQLLYEFERTSHPHERAELFSQILEESEHAQVFARIYEEMTHTKMTPLLIERKPLYSKPADFWKLNVYCQVGEAQAVKRFQDIARSLPHGPLRTAVDKILEDEAHHVTQAAGLVQVKGRTPEEVQKLTRQIRLTRLQDAWMRAGRAVVSVLSKLLLKIVYRIVGPIGRRLL